MSHKNDERRPWQGGGSSSRLAGRDQSGTTGPVPGPHLRVVSLEQAVRDAQDRQRRRLASQLQRAVTERRAVGDDAGARLAAAWLAEAVA